MDSEYIQRRLYSKHVNKGDCYFRQFTEFMMHGIEIKKSDRGMHESSR